MQALMRTSSRLSLASVLMWGPKLIGILMILLKDRIACTVVAQPFFNLV